MSGTFHPCKTTGCAEQAQAWVQTEHPMTHAAVTHVYWTTQVVGAVDCYCWDHLRLYMETLVDSFKDRRERVSTGLQIGGYL